MQRFFFILLSIFILSMFAGCTSEQPTETPTETATGGGIAVETPTPTAAPKEEREIIALTKNITKDGITFIPYSKDDPLWEKGDSFFVKNENLKILKNGKASIYDMIYFYDGMVIKFTGDVEEKTEYSQIIPEDKTQIEINLIDEYKQIASTSQKGDETPIDVVNDDNSKADKEFDGVFCKFTLPAKYGNKVTIDYNINTESHSGSITVLYKEIGICEIIKSPDGDGDIILAKANGYVYSLNKEYIVDKGKNFKKQANKIISIIKKNFKVVSY